MSNGTEGNWFDDDPEWDELRKRVDGQPIPKKPKITPDRLDSNTTKTDEKEPKKVELSLNLTLPKLKIPKLPKSFPNIPKYKSLQDLKKHKKIVIPAGVIVVIIVSGTIFGLATNNDQKSTNPTGVLADVSQNPTFKALRPKQDDSTTKIQYDSTKKVASFTDKIEATEITVSQQELPEPFRAEPDSKVAELAKNINANEVINESNPKAYLGTSIKGPQTVVFHKNGLLVFIKAPNAIEKAAWAAYITQLL